MPLQELNYDTILSDTDINSVSKFIHNIFKDDYVCCDIFGNIWYKKTKEGYKLNNTFIKDIQKTVPILIYNFIKKMNISKLTSYERCKSSKDLIKNIFLYNKINILAKFLVLIEDDIFVKNLLIVSSYYFYNKDLITDASHKEEEDVPLVNIISYEKKPHYLDCCTIL